MISWIVTGFGPFAGVPDNPTMTIVQSLIPYLAEEEQEQASSSSPTNHHSTTVPLSQRIRTLVVETSYRAVQEQMEEIYHHRQQQQQQACDTVILLHLGVKLSGKYYQLESCAYNEMQFRVPDQRGDQPMNCPIVVVLADDHSILPPMVPYPASISTNLYHLLEPMCQQLNDTHHRRSRCRSNHHPITSTIPLTLRGGGSSSGGSTLISTNHDRDDDDDDNDYDYGTTCVVSTDPGRFVCNYIYYYSLSLFRAATDDAPMPVRREPTAPPPNNGHDADPNRLVPCTPTTNNNHYQCLFVHVPPLTVASVAQQLRFVTDLMRQLERTLTSSSESTWR